MANRNQLLKTIWGMAKELGLSRDDLYVVLYRETQKESMKACSDNELSRVVQGLVIYKENKTRRKGMATKRQLWKIGYLEQQLGWQDNPKRLKSFIQKYYHREQQEWLTFSEAGRLIDSLKNVLLKQEEQEDQEQQEASSDADSNPIAQ